MLIHFLPTSRFFMAQSYAGLICYMAWVSSVFAHPPAKRAVAIALINAVSQIGNVAGRYVSVLYCTRSEIGVRMAFFYCGSISSNAFGALLASGILKAMKGAMGRAAWRWLFYVGSCGKAFVVIGG